MLVDMARETSGMKKRKEEEFRLPDIEKMSAQLEAKKPAERLVLELEALGKLSKSKKEYKIELSQKIAPQKEHMVSLVADKKTMQLVETEFGAKAIGEIARQLKMKI
ncbi:Uncharacterised protein [uncultured archaeon]|nr:Uncharacterised protein [uncultured archaeon]